MSMVGFFDGESSVLVDIFSAFCPGCFAIGTGPGGRAIGSGVGCSLVCARVGVRVMGSGVDCFAAWSGFTLSGAGWVVDRSVDECSVAGSAGFGLEEALAVWKESGWDSSACIAKGSVEFSSWPGSGAAEDGVAELFSCLAASTANDVNPAKLPALLPPGSGAALDTVWIGSFSAV